MPFPPPPATTPPPTPPPKVPLTVLPSEATGQRGGSGSNRGSHLRAIVLRLYRLAIICAIVFVIHRHYSRLRIDSGAEITIDEIRPFFPAAAKLDPDTSERRGLFVLDKGSNPVGY